MKNNILIIIVVVALVVGAGGFFAGMKYQQGQRGQAFTQQFGAGRNFGGNGITGQGQNRFRNGGGQVIGEILNQDDKSITVKLPDGSSKIVILSDTTTYNKASVGSKSDLKAGERIAVFGTTNSDGSVTAQNIQLNPVFKGATVSGTPKQ